MALDLGLSFDDGRRAFRGSKRLAPLVNRNHPNPKFGSKVLESAMAFKEVPGIAVATHLRRVCRFTMLLISAKGPGFGRAPKVLHLP